MSAAPPTLRSTVFRRQREAQWRELEDLLRRVESKGLQSLGPDEVYRLPALYRAAVSSLSVARSISLDRALLDYLEALVARSYFCVYGARPRGRRPVRTFVGHTLPAVVRRRCGGILLALLLLGSGVLVGRVYDDPETFALILPADVAQGRSPTSTTEELRAVLYSQDEHSGETLGLFATFLFTHNARIGLLAFAVGFALGIPSVLLLFHNGLILGAMAGLYGSRGMGLEFWAWVLPHGVTELLAVALCGGAGLTLAGAVLRPGPHGRLHALSQAGREAAQIVLGAVGLFLIAGLIEGVFRQLVHDVTVRYAVAALSLVGWALYFGLAGRARVSGTSPVQVSGTSAVQVSGTSAVHVSGTSSVQVSGTPSVQVTGTSSPVQVTGTSSPVQVSGTSPVQVPGTSSVQVSGTGERRP